MRKQRWMALAAVLALLLTACGGTGTGGQAGNGTGNSRTITAREGKALMDAGGVIVVDVRRADEYEAGHIPGAINIPNESISNAPPEALEDLDATLIVYCRTGVRSANAAAKLAAMGYTDVADMGGFVSWPYDTVTGSAPGTYGKESGT